jgi:5S rRNA maturation endonuclease (ribonuclease M5)
MFTQLFARFFSRPNESSAHSNPKKPKRPTPEVSELINRLTIAAAIDSTNQPGKLSFKHRRTAQMFRVIPKRTQIPAGVLRKDAFIPDPWWQPNEKIDADQPLRLEQDGTEVLEENTLTIELLNGEKISQIRTVYRAPAGRRFKVFLAKLKDGKEISFDDIPQEQLPLYFPKPIPPEAKPIILVEGAKAANSLSKQGYSTAATLNGALGTPSHQALQPLLGKSQIILWPDNDDVGVRHMQRVAEKLHQMGIKHISVIRWLRGPKKGDAADFNGSSEDLAKLIAGAQPWSLDVPIRNRGVMAVNPPTSDLNMTLATEERPPAPVTQKIPALLRNATWRQAGNCQSAATHDKGAQ